MALALSANVVVAGDCTNGGDITSSCDITSNISGNIFTGNGQSRITVNVNNGVTFTGNIGGKESGSGNTQPTYVNFNSGSKLVGNILTGSNNNGNSYARNEIVFNAISNSSDFVMTGKIASYGTGWAGSVNSAKGNHVTFKKGSLKGNIEAYYRDSRYGYNEIYFSDASGEQKIEGSIWVDTRTPQRPYVPQGKKKETKNKITFEGKASIGGNGQKIENYGGTNEIILKKGGLINANFYVNSGDNIITSDMALTLGNNKTITATTSNAVRPGKNSISALSIDATNLIIEAKDGGQPQKTINELIETGRGSRLSISSMSSSGRNVCNKITLKAPSLLAIHNLSVASSENSVTVSEITNIDAIQIGNINNNAGINTITALQSTVNFTDGAKLNVVGGANGSNTINAKEIKAINLTLSSGETNPNGVKKNELLSHSGTINISSMNASIQGQNIITLTPQVSNDNILLNIENLSTNRTVNFKTGIPAGINKITINDNQTSSATQTISIGTISNTSGTNSIDASNATLTLKTRMPVDDYAF